MLAAGAFALTGANEARADLEVHLRLVAVAPGRVAHGPAATGIARIEVTVEARNATSDVRLRVLRADGTDWTVQGRPFALDRPMWIVPEGYPIDSGPDGQVLPARRPMRTTIEVPLEGSALHDVGVALTGVVDGRTLTAQSFVRAALGVSDGQPVDDGTFAHFPVKGIE
jgi:hypothetical protein